MDARGQPPQSTSSRCTTASECHRSSHRRPRHAGHQPPRTHRTPSSLSGPTRSAMPRTIVESLGRHRRPDLWRFHLRRRDSFDSHFRYANAQRLPTVIIGFCRSFHLQGEARRAGRSQFWSKCALGWERDRMCPLLTRQRSGAPSVPEGTEAAPLTDHQGTLTAAPQDRSLEFLVAAVTLLCARRGECSLLATLHTSKRPRRVRTMWRGGVVHAVAQHPSFIPHMSLSRCGCAHRRCHEATTCSYWASGTFRMRVPSRFEYPNRPPSKKTTWLRV